MPGQPTPCAAAARTGAQRSGRPVVRASRAVVALTCEEGADGRSMAGVMSSLGGRFSRRDAETPEACSESGKPALADGAALRFAQAIFAWLWVTHLGGGWGPELVAGLQSITYLQYQRQLPHHDLLSVDCGGRTHAQETAIATLKLYTL